MMRFLSLAQCNPAYQLRIEYCLTKTMSFLRELTFLIAPSYFDDPQRIQALNSTSEKHGSIQALRKYLRSASNPSMPFQQFLHPIDSSTLWREIHQQTALLINDPREIDSQI